MGMSSLFKNLPKIVFGIAGDLSVKGTYSVTIDDGFGTSDISEYSLDIIPSTFKQEDRQKLPYGDVILPTDVKGLVGTYSISVKIESGNFISFNGVSYRVEGVATDAALALYILLLRTF